MAEGFDGTSGGQGATGREQESGTGAERAASGATGFERGSSAIGSAASGLGNSTNALGDGMSRPGEDQGVRARATEVKRDVLDRAVEKKDELKQRAAGVIDERKTGAAQRVNSISRALSGAADSLRDSGEPQLSDWVRQAASQVERVVDYLDGKPVDGMVGDLEDMARRNPALFMGGTYVAGLALGRFLRASAPEPQFGSPAGSAYGSTPSDSGSGWSGAAVGPSIGGQFGAAGDGEAGLTDEDLREAWHGTDSSVEPPRDFSAGSVHHDALETGELTSYTNGPEPLDAGVNESDRSEGRFERGFGDADRGRGE